MDWTEKQKHGLSDKDSPVPLRSDVGTPTEAEQAVEESIWLVASRFGVHPDAVSKAVDQFGPAACIRALDKVQEAQARGSRIVSPFGFMVSLLRAGTIQAELAHEQVEAKAVGGHSNWLRERYERAQADPRQDTAAKRLAKVKLDPELAALEAEKCR